MMTIARTGQIIFHHEHRRIFTNLDGLQAKVNELRELQVKSGKELCPFAGRTLMPSILDKAFKGEL